MITWTLESGVLTIAGTGAMDDVDQPWENARGLIIKVVIRPGITQIGDLAFAGCENLTSVEIPASVFSVGRDAFLGCTSLALITYSGSESAWKAALSWYGVCLMYDTQVKYLS